MTGIPILPPSASSVSTEVDLLYLFLTGVTAFFVVLVAALVVYFAIKYRRRHPGEVGADIHGSLVLELTWTIIPLVLSMVMFAWGASLFFRLSKPPQDAMQLYIVGKQWMWKVQHPEGVREINELHVPVNRDVRITLGSEDVIHDYGIPAFRVKMDAVPGRLTTLWFRATVPGTYHIYCDRVLRHATLADDRRGDGDGAAGVPGLALRRRHRRRREPERRAAVQGPQLRDVPHCRREGPGPIARGPCGPARSSWRTAGRSGRTTTTCASRS